MSVFDHVKNASEQLKAYTKAAVDDIYHICETFGPRPCGEDGEKNAQLYLMEELKKAADEGTVKRETYKVSPEAFMGFVPVGGTLLLSATAFNFLSAYKKKNFAVGSLACIAATLVEIVEEFGLYKEFLDKLPMFPEKESGNVYGVRKAKGETKRRIFVAGHTDSAPEWTYTYRLGSHGVVMVAGYAVLGLLYNTATSLVSMFGSRDAAKNMTKGLLAFLPAYAALYFFTNPKLHVPGASDDLSGTEIALSVMKFLDDNDIRFENTEVVTLLPGGEEAGLRGAKAFFKAHPEYAEDGVETMYAGFDTVRDADFMAIYKGDMSGVVKNDIRCCNLLQAAAKDAGCDVPIGTIPLGSTDAAAASQAGVPATCFVAMDPAPARYYHTRLDTPDNVVPETVQKGLEIALNTVFRFDEDGLDKYSK